MSPSGIISTLVLLSVLTRSSAKHAYTPSSSISPAEWNALNATVGGRLKTALPFSSPCFSIVNGVQVEPNSQLCSIVQENFTNSFYRVEQFGSSMETPWETCIQENSKCVLDDTNPFDPAAYNPPMSCDQGSVASFYIDVAYPSDIQAAFNFSLFTGVPLSIKNTGHDYKGRSSGVDTLGIWTHHLQDISYESKFIPNGCLHRATLPAMRVAAGVVWDSAYKFADKNAITIVGGYHETVGASGGWIMGGGHSVLSPAYGLGVDRVLQFTIVTPDGRLRVANSCQNSDLFWALRGGGGGTFGVVLETVYEVLPHPVTLQGLFVNYTQSAANVEAFYSMIINNTELWHEQQWGGHVEFNRMVYVTPNLTMQEAEESMAPAINFALANGGVGAITTYSSWLEFYNDQVLFEDVNVGTTNSLASRLIPTDLFTSQAGKASILSMVNEILSLGSLPYIPVVTPPFRNTTNNETSVTPAWYNSLWHLIYSQSWHWNSSVDAVTEAFEQLHNVTDMMANLTPGSGAYLNEGDVFQQDFEDAFWGPNYPKLQQVKAKYDPEHLLDCHQCVGFESQSSQFRCYPAVQTAA